MKIPSHGMRATRADMHRRAQKAEAARDRAELQAKWWLDAFKRAATREAAERRRASALFQNPLNRIIALGKRFP